MASMLDGIIHDFERVTGPWHLERMSLPQSFLLTASSLANTKFMSWMRSANRAAVRSHCDPMNYVGLAPQMVDNARPRGPLETEQWESVGSWS